MGKTNQFGQKQYFERIGAKSKVQITQVFKIG